MFFLWSPFVGASKLQSLSIKDLDFDYASPEGAGVANQVQIGLGLWAPGIWPLEVHRTESDYVVESPLFSLVWKKPAKFYFQLQNLSVKALTGIVDKEKHEITSELLNFTPEQGGDYAFQNLQLTCLGKSLDELLVNRLLSDCRESMKLEVEKVLLPLNFFLVDIWEGLPKVPNDISLPIKDFALRIQEGKFHFSLQLKYYIKSVIKAQGEISYADNYRTLVIRVDQVKYGIFPVTNLFFRELKKRVQSSRVLIDAPWIRIQMNQGL